MRPCKEFDSPDCGSLVQRLMRDWRHDLVSCYMSMLAKWECLLHMYRFLARRT